MDFRLVLVCQNCHEQDLSLQPKIAERDASREGGDENWAVNVTGLKIDTF